MNENNSEKYFGMVIPNGTVSLDKTISVTSPCSRLTGEVWAYNSDPNGVFEARSGSKLKLKTKGFPAIEVGDGAPTEGFQFFNFGIQGAIQGMDTRPLVNFSEPSLNAGILFATSRTDQGECKKLSFCGLGVGVCATGDAELDACRFTDCNFDGCGVGVYFSPRASYYSKVSGCVIADTPYSGIFVDGIGCRIHSLEITENHFVRNGGAFSEENYIGYPNEVPYAAICLRGVSDGLVRNNLADFPGTFWYYSDNATSNSERQIFCRKTIGLYLEGSGNRIIGNAFRHSSSQSAIIRGNNNILICNTSDGDIVLEGSNNIVRNLVFTGPEARLVLRCDGALDTEQSDVPQSRIVHLY